MGNEVEKVADKVATAVADAVADTPTPIAPSDKPAKEETLDAQTELFVRRLTDSVRNAVAELLNPSKADDTTTEDEDEDEREKKPRKKRTPTPNAAPKKKSYMHTLFG